MTDTKAELPTLPVLHSKRIPNPIRFPFTAYCHVHDLLAIVTSAWEVSVLRIASGQNAFIVKRKDQESEITALSWKQDGTCLGIGWTDGTYGIYDGGIGKQLFMTALSADRTQTECADWKLDLTPYFPDDDEDGARLSKANVLGWNGHQVVQSRKRESDAPLTTEEWYDGLDDEDGAKDLRGSTKGAAMTDLPQAITSLDVTKILPRLSAVPSHNLPLAKGGGNNTKFSSQLSTDNVFANEEGNKTMVIQSLLVCQDSGSVQVLLDETVHIGTCRITGKPIMHAAYAESGAHAILAQAEGGELMLNLIGLPLQTLGSSLLHVIATNTKRVQTILEYILQTVRCIEHDYSTEIATPLRFLKALQADLDDRKDGSTCVSTLYHLAMTGAFHADLLKWLVDVIRDQNYKRWELILNGMYSNLQNHLFMNLLPAIDRFSIAVTTLRGLATFHEGSAKFDCPPHLFSNVLDKVDSLRLVAQKMLLTVQNEHRQCRAFLKWLKMQLEIGIAEPFSSSALETEEREVPSLDYALVLSYIKESMMTSKLELHIKERPSMRDETTKEKFFDHDVIRNMSYERTKKAINDFDPLRPDQGLRQKDVDDPVALVNLPAITCALVGHVRVVLEQITHWQSRMLSSPKVMLIGDVSGVTIADMLMCANGTTKVLEVSPSQSNQLSITEVTTANQTSREVYNTDDLQVLSARFMPHNENAVLTLSKHENGDISIVRHDLGSAGSIKHKVLHTFLAGISFKPFDIIVGGRKGKTVCVVFGNQGREWRALDLDGTKGLSMADVAEVLESVAGDDGDEEMEEL